MRWLFFFIIVISAYAKEIEVLHLDIIPYEKFLANNEEALCLLKQALYEKGIVGIKGIPTFQEKFRRFIDSARNFTALSEEVKEKYQPIHEKGETFLGYEKGKEKFMRPDGSWVVDDLKVSYYAFLPHSSQNKWPKEVLLKEPFEQLGTLMSQMGYEVLQKIQLFDPSSQIIEENGIRIGRMLYYAKSKDTLENPYWCGAHFDHGLFTVLLPAVYYKEGEEINEPLEAGLFVRTSKDQPFKKVMANDLDVMIFQVGEFGQLATHDAIRATEHLVHKAIGPIERYTMAVFFDAAYDIPIYSESELTQDDRYGNVKGEACTYRHWHEASFKRYLVK